MLLLPSAGSGTRICKPVGFSRAAARSVRCWPAHHCALEGARGEGWRSSSASIPDADAVPLRRLLTPSRSLCGSGPLASFAMTVLADTAASGSNPRWTRFKENGYVHPGRRSRRWLCREHAPLQEVNQHATRCANYVVCSNHVASLTQLKKQKDKRFCDTCKAARRVSFCVSLMKYSPVARR